MEQINKLLILFGLLLFFNGYAQVDKKFFITKDTLYIKNPVILSFKGEDGMFLINEDSLENKKKINIIKMLHESKAFILSEEFYRFLNLIELENSPRYNDCNFTSIKEYKKNIIIRKYDDSVKKFLICFIRIDFYNDKTIGSNNNKTAFPKKKNLDFYKILFPICEQK